MSKNVDDIVVVIHHFDRALSFLRIIPFDTDHYLCTHFGWVIQLGNALRQGGSYEYDNH